MPFVKKWNSIPNAHINTERVFNMSCCLRPFMYNQSYWTVSQIYDSNHSVCIQPAFHQMYTYETDVVRNVADIQKKLNKILELLEG